MSFFRRLREHSEEALYPLFARNVATRLGQYCLLR
jgi:hypothetical protein